MKKNQIRKAVPITKELEDKLFELRNESQLQSINGNLSGAVRAIDAAWEMIPPPKFNNPCTNIVITEMVRIYIEVKKYSEAENILHQWIQDEEGSGYLIHYTRPYIFLADVYLYMNEIDKAKEQFLKAAKYKAIKRDFYDKPAFYYDIVKKKLTDNNEIAALFQKEVLEKN